MSDNDESIMRKVFCNGDDHYAEANKKLSDERHKANAQAMRAEAYRHMPSDLRHMAKTWGVGALMELVWMNGWDCGYRQSARDADDLRSVINEHD